MADLLEALKEILRGFHILTPPRDPWRFSAVVLGELGSKSNSRRIVSRTQNVIRDGKIHARTIPGVIKSDAALNYVTAFRYQVKRHQAAYEGDVVLIATCYYRDRRKDLDIALFQDCLQTNRKENWMGLIANDRQVVELHLTRKIDNVRPRVEFQLIAVE